MAYLHDLGQVISVLRDVTQQPDLVLWCTTKIDVPEFADHVLITTLDDYKVSYWDYLGLVEAAVTIPSVFMTEPDVHIRSKEPPLVFPLHLLKVRRLAEIDKNVHDPAWNYINAFCKQYWWWTWRDVEHSLSVPSRAFTAPFDEFARWTASSDFAGELAAGLDPDIHTGNVMWDEVAGRVRVVDPGNGPAYSWFNGEYLMELLGAGRRVEAVLRAFLKENACNVGREARLHTCAV